MKHFSKLNLVDIFTIGIIVFFLTTIISYGKFSIEQLILSLILLILLIGLLQMWSKLNDISKSLRDYK